jgi:hypothetical protein
MKLSTAGNYLVMPLSQSTNSKLMVSIRMAINPVDNLLQLSLVSTD